MKIVLQRDVDLLVSLWKFKLLTTHAIWLAHYPDTAVKTCYERLMKLKKSNHIRRVNIGDKGSAWTLSVKGFQHIREFLPDLKQSGYGSDSPIHDLLIPLAMFGDNWPSLPHGTSVLSEDEIKRCYIEHLPKWYPLELLRRPDGLWHIEGNGRTALLALEIETTLKSTMSYEIIARQYRDATSVSKVIWCVPSESMAQSIYSCFQNKIGVSDFRHNFILISDLVVNGWRSPILLGPDKQIPLEKLLDYTNGISSIHGRSRCHLDISITPHKSPTSKLLYSLGIPNLATYLKSPPFSSLIQFR
jgi:hypothetical protein